MKQLDKNALWYFRLGAYAFWMIIAIFLTIFSTLIIISLLENESLFFIVAGFEIVILIVIGVIVAEIYAKMSYDRWFYDFTNEGIKIEKGIIWKKYSYISYARIQNVEIHRGILARMLNYSRLDIQTAGYSGVHVSEGRLPAISVQEAEKLREFLIDKITNKELNKEKK